MSGEPLLNVSGLTAGYGPIEVLHGLDFTVAEGEIVVILGANGAGKTTTMRSISGMIDRHGTVGFAGHDISNAKPDAILRAGISQVPQGRGTFTDLSVDDNLRAGGYTVSGGIDDDLERWYGLFPRLVRSPRTESRIVVGWRAADARSRSGDDVETQVVALRRAEPGTRAIDHQGVVPGARLVA